MTRSERLFQKGLVYSVERLSEAKIISDCNAVPELRYICTEREALCNGKEVDLDLYEDPNGELFAVVCW